MFARGSGRSAANSGSASKPRTSYWHPGIAALLGQPIDVGRLHKIRVRTVAANAALAQIVCQDHNDVGPLGCRVLGPRRVGKREHAHHDAHQRDSGDRLASGIGPWFGILGGRW